MENMVPTVSFWAVFTLLRFCWISFTILLVQGIKLRKQELKYDKGYWIGSRMVNYNLTVCSKPCLDWRWVSFTDWLKKTPKCEQLQISPGFGNLGATYFLTTEVTLVSAVKEIRGRGHHLEGLSAVQERVKMLPWTQAVTVDPWANSKQENLRKVCPRLCWGSLSLWKDQD